MKLDHLILPTITESITIVTDETLNGFNKQTKNMLNSVIIEILIFLVTHNDTCILSVKHGQYKKTTTTKTKGYTGCSTIRPQREAFLHVYLKLQLEIKGAAMFCFHIVTK